MTTSLSAVRLPDGCAVVFDLDDTLYLERDFARSGMRAAAELIEQEAGVAVFDRLWELFVDGHFDPFAAIIAEHRLPPIKSRLVAAYRDHSPALTLAPEVRKLLARLKSAGHPLGIMTDGRASTQRRKTRALGLDRWASEIVISEEFGSAKPATRNYRRFEAVFPGRRLAYVGNDLSKDFVTANRLGWLTVCVLDHGDHIRPQIFDAVPRENLPRFVIERLA